MRDDPLVIFGSPRGGTSVAAGLFVAHGWWTGTTFPGTHGYVNHENAEIKEFIKEHFKLNAGVPEPDPGKADLAGFCRNIVPSQTMWLFKGPAEYYPIFRFWFPEMQAVFAFRDLEQAIGGATRRGADRKIAEPIIRNRYDYLNRMLGDLNTWRLDVDRVVKGDLSQIAPIIEWCGIEFDYHRAMATVDPSIFHMN
jgi:hypothetical protein